MMTINYQRERESIDDFTFQKKIVKSTTFEWQIKLLIEKKKEFNPTRKQIIIIILFCITGNYVNRVSKKKIYI